MSVPLTSDKFDEYTDCVMVGHRWGPCDCNFPCGFKVCETCSAEEDL